MTVVYKKAVYPLACLCGGMGGIFILAFDDLLQYRRAEILSGQLWRLLSAHLVHSSVAHVGWNGLGFCLFWLVFYRYLSIRYLCYASLFMGLFISGMLLCCHPDIQWYQGFSGILHGLFVLGALDDIAQKRMGGYPLLCLLLCKVIWEVLSGHPTHADLIGPVLVHAHVYGVMAGLCLGGGHAITINRRR